MPGCYAWFVSWGWRKALSKVFEYFRRAAIVSSPPMVVNPSFPRRYERFHVALIAVRCSKNSAVPSIVQNSESFEIKSKGVAVRKTTLAAIAAEAGVSLPTVSKVVNGRPDVAPTTRARVEQLLDQHQYRRNGLRMHRRSGLIDLVFNGLDSPWAVEILRGVEEWGAEHSTAIAVSSVRHGDARPASWTSAIASHHSDGVILVTTTLTSAQVGQLRGAGHPARRHRPGQHPAPGHPVRRRDELGGRARRHRAPAVPRPPADRRDHRVPRHAVQHGPARRLPLGP